MGIVIRQSIKGTLVSYVGAFIGYLNVIFIYPYCLTPDIIGFNKIFLDFGLLFTFLAQLGLNSGMVKYFPFFKDGKTNHGILFLIVAIPLAGLLLLSVIVFIFKAQVIGYFANNSPLFAENYSYVIPLTFFMMFLGLFETYSACMLRIVVPKMIREILMRLLNICIIALFYFKVIDFKQFVLLIIFIHATAAALNLYYLSRLTTLSLVPKFSEIPKSVLTDFAKYTLFILFVGIGTNIVNKVDVFMISSTINLTNTGIFSIAFYITTIIEIPSRSFQQITNPIIADAFASNNTKPLADIYYKSSLNQFLVGGIILIIIWINVDNIFSIMPNGKIYEAGKYVILFMGLAKVFDMVTGVNWLIIANSKYYPYQIVFILYLTTATVALNFLLIPKYGISGAAFASLISLSTYNIFLLAFLKIKLNLWPFKKTTIIAALGLIALAGLNYFIPFILNYFFDAVIRTILIGAGFIIFLFVSKISPEFNAIIKGINLKNLKSMIPR